jgi:hypothetical protein
LSLTKPITSFAWRGQSGKLSAQLPLSGGRYFFIVNLAYRRRALLTDPIDVLRAAFRRVRVPVMMSSGMSR